MKKVSCLLVGILPLFALLLPVAAAQDLTFTVAAPKLQVMNAAYMAAHDQWKFEALSVPLGTLWFTISATHPEAYECGLVVNDAGAVTVRLFDRQEEVKGKDRAKLADRIVRSIRVHLRDKLVLKVDSVIDVTDPYRDIFRGYSADAVYAAVLRSGHSQWTVLRENPAGKSAIFVSTRATSEPDVMAIRVIDLGNTEVRLETLFRNTAGSESKVGYEGKLSASRVLREMVLRELAISPSAGPR